MQKKRKILHFGFSITFWSQTLMRVRRFRASANKIPLQSFRARKTFFNDKDNGLLKERYSWITRNCRIFLRYNLFRQAPQQNAVDKMMMNNPMMDPSNVVEMLKRNMLMIVPQLLIMAGVNYFFSGFVLGTVFWAF